MLLGKPLDAINRLDKLVFGLDVGQWVGGFEMDGLRAGDLVQLLYHVACFCYLR